MVSEKSAGSVVSGYVRSAELTAVGTGLCVIVAGGARRARDVSSTALGMLVIVKVGVAHATAGVAQRSWCVE